MNSATLAVLDRWCRSRDLSWSAASIVGSPSAMSIRPSDAGRPWGRMVLVLDEAELRLENELGETLASASDLPALLDAVDGGVAEPPVLPGRVLAGLLSLPLATAPTLGLLSSLVF